MIDEETNQRKAKQLRKLLFGLVLAVTFEGLMRKIIPELTNVLFFLKDFLVLVIAVYLLSCRMPRTGRWVLLFYWIVVVLFLPAIGLTWSDDPILAIFGAKQYLLFPVVAIAAVVAFVNSSEEEVVGFFRVCALLIIPTTLLALLQLRLPSSHWLNAAVGGGSTEGFAAGGELRVSSSFPFVAQYSMFLNAQMYILAFPLLVGTKARGKWLNFVYLSLLPLLIIGCFITGSRGAVLLNLSMVATAGILTILKGRVHGMLGMVTIAALGYLAFVVLKTEFPNAFAAYDARSAGTVSQTHSQEMSGRVYEMLTAWTKGLPSAPASLFGYGLGVMSNGSDKVSQYAAGWRAGGRWNETDLATTLFEGGYYLIVVWMGFRLSVLAVLLAKYLHSSAKTLMLPMTFCMGYAFIIGPFGTLGIQPPEAIWFWLCVGLMAAMVSRTEQAPVAGAYLNGINGTGGAGAAQEPAPQPIGRRGRSPYAERLHAHTDD